MKQMAANTNRATRTTADIATNIQMLVPFSGLVCGCFIGFKSTTFISRIVTPSCFDTYTFENSNASLVVSTFSISELLWLATAGKNTVYCNSSVVVERFFGYPRSIKISVEVNVTDVIVSRRLRTTLLLEKKTIDNLGGNTYF